MCAAPHKAPPLPWLDCKFPEVQACVVLIAEFPQHLVQGQAQDKLQLNI